MKKFFYLVIILLSSTFSGCSSESDFITEDLGNSQEATFCSFEDFFHQDTEEFIGWTSSLNSPIPMTKSSVNTITLNGYSSKKSSGNQKFIMDKKLADLMGIMQQIYIIEYITVYQDIKIDGLGSTAYFAPLESPLCGLEPNNKDYKRGYNSSAPDENGNIRLASKCIHVICDLAGRSYNKWYPCKPEEFQWKYNLISL